jgi:hypothetical protein
LGFQSREEQDTERRPGESEFNNPFFARRGTGGYFHKNGDSHNSNIACGAVRYSLAQQSLEMTSLVDNTVYADRLICF